MRAPGAPQAVFALESHLDEIARRLEMDPLDFRLHNIVVEGDEARLRRAIRRYPRARDARGGCGTPPATASRGRNSSGAVWRWATTGPGEARAARR